MDALMQSVRTEERRQPHLVHARVESWVDGAFDIREPGRENVMAGASILATGEATDGDQVLALRFDRGQEPALFGSSPWATTPVSPVVVNL